VAVLLLTIAAGSCLVLAMMGYLQRAHEFLDSDAMSFWIGDMRFSAYLVIRNLLVILALIWVTGILSNFGRERIKSLHRLKSNNRSILSKGYQVILYIGAFLFGLHILGIDLTGLAIFSGAIGIGVGFGLQKITSNFISGMILLFEKSIEEGDLIEMSDGVAGFVRDTGARYTLVETFEGREIMIPNEDFITNRVTNWTFSNSQGRIDINIGVSYGSDIGKAYDIMLETANEHPRSSPGREAECFLVDFGESSVDFTLYFWVDDIIDGRKRPRSDVLFTIWKKFKEAGIEIPFPQRDLHIKQSEIQL
jgi:small-conductance mechanosensitive channel